LLDAPEDQLRREAAVGLDRLSGAARTEALLEALDRGSPFARTYAARTLAESAPREALRPLIRNLSHKRHEVREAAVLALRRLADPRAVRAVARLVNDPRIDTRLEAILTLADLADLRARAALERACRDPSARVRQTAVFALARCGGRAAAP